MYALTGNPGFASKKSSKENLISILQDVTQMHSSADEMELFAQANKKFRQTFNRQEHMKTFKTYDRVEVCMFLV